VTAELLEQEAVLFPVKSALLYIPSTPLAVGGQGYQGGGMFRAPNPPFGAVFTYRIDESLKGPKEARRDREKEIRKEDGDVPFPGWETLTEEAAANAPKIILTVRNSAENVVRRIEGPETEGFHRVAWDLRHPSSRPTDLSPPRELPPWADAPGGPRVAPGTYSVELSRLVDSEWISMGERRTFDVVALNDAGVQRPDAQTVAKFQHATADLQRRMLGANAEIARTDERLRHMRQAMLDTPGAEASLLTRVGDLQADLREIRTSLTGDRTRGPLNEPTSPSPLARVRQIVGGQDSTLQGPTQTHRRNYDIALAAYEEIAPKLRNLIEVDLVALEADLEAAGAPWTPGRRVPGAP